MAQIPSVRDRVAPRRDTLFAALLKQYPRCANLVVSDTKGQIFCSGLPMDGPSGE